MTQQLQSALQAARALSIEEKQKLLEALSHDLAYQPLSEAAAVFWLSPSLEELIKQQSAPVVTDIYALKADFWPEEESADEFNRFVAARPQGDRPSEA